MRRWLGQRLWEALRPYAPRRRPVSAWTRALHRCATALAGPNPAKGKVPARWSPGEYYDADLARELVDAGTIQTTVLTIPPDRYAALQWSVAFSDEVLSQGEGSGADLIWVLTMPASRAAAPVLFFHEPGDPGPKLLDGCHRIIRSVVDGATALDVEVIGQGDEQHFRKRRL